MRTKDIPHRAWTSQEINQVRHLYRRRSLLDIAETTQRSRSDVLQMVIDLGLHTNPEPKGEYLKRLWTESGTVGKPINTTKEQIANTKDVLTEARQRYDDLNDILNVIKSNAAEVLEQIKLIDGMITNSVIAAPGHAGA